MATLGEVQDRINNDYLNRTDLTAETKRAIAGAVRFYERQRFWFNETVTTMVTVAGNGEIAVPANFLVLDELEYRAGPWSLIQTDMGDLRHLRHGTASGQPTHFAIFRDQFQLFPIPNTSYSLSVSYIKQLAIIEQTTGTATTNAWYSACEDLIVYHATKTMWANVLRNTEEALKYAELERREFDQIMMANEQRFYHAIKATKF